MPSEADWNLLARLFADEHAAFRHQMGLTRISTEAFYAPSLDAASVRAEKERLLAGAEASRYLLETGEGQTAFGEFTHLVNPVVGVPAMAAETRTQHREIALALEPDWLLLLSPGWRLVSASVCFPTRWSLAGKAGQPLTDIHAIVPGLNAQIGQQINVFFDRLTPGQGWSRANWGLSTNTERNQHPDLPYDRLTDQWPLDQVWLRMESQHFCKLPQTGAIAFGIRILHFALPMVLERDPIAAGLRERLRTMPAEVAAYKGIPPDFWRRL